MALFLLISNHCCILQTSITNQVSDCLQPPYTYIHLPSPIVLITCIKTHFTPVVFLGSYNFCDVVFNIICHDVLYQFLCIAHV